MNKQQELIRRIMVVAIMVLIVALVVLLACILTRGTCSNKHNNGIIPMNTPEATAIIDISNTTPQPTEEVEPTELITQFVPESVPPVINTTYPSPVIPKSPYPSIPYCVTEGSMEDVNARLALLKQLPSSATIILLDVGHGGFDGGTVGIDTKVTEADVNLAVGRRLSEELASRGYFVFMTRMGDYALGRSKNDDMKWRKNVMKLGIFDLSISIHMNALDTDRDVSGARIYCYKKGTEGEKLASAVIEGLKGVSANVRSTVYTGNLMVVREPVCPAVLAECGFLSNHNEELLLQDPAYQAKLAKGLADGIVAYLKNH